MIEKMGFETHTLREVMPYGRARGEEVEINGQTIYFKSQTEVKFARILERLREVGAILAWAYEPKEFVFDDIKFGTRKYKPDFWVIWAPDIHNDETPGEVWYETKSANGLRQRDITKYRRMARRYPDIKLVLVLPRQLSDGSSRSAIKQRILLDKAKKYIDHPTYLTDWKV